MDKKRLILDQFKQRLAQKYGQVKYDHVKYPNIVPYSSKHPNLNNYVLFRSTIADKVFDNLLKKPKVSAQVQINHNCLVLIT